MRTPSAIWRSKRRFHKLTQDLGVGAQFGGKYFCHDVRVIRLPRHGASLPSRARIGNEAPWRGRRIARTSWQKYLPPNCAPTPSRCVSL